MDSEFKGTIKPNEDFDDEAAAKRFKKAMKGMGTDEKALIRLVTTHDSAQRLEIVDAYNKMYGQNLIEDLKEELGGHFEDTVVALLTPPYEFMVTAVKNAFSGMGTNEDTLVEIFCCRSAEEMESLFYDYEYKYERPLQDDINSELSGPFKKLMSGLLAAGREYDEEETDPEKAAKEAQELYDAGVGMNDGTDESEFTNILNNRSFAQLKLTFEEYEKLDDSGIEGAIKSQFNGEMQKGLLGIVQRVKDPLGFFAERLHKSMAGAGTDDKTLIRIIVSRSEIDLADIRKRYQEMFGNDLAKDIEGDTSGDYQKLLLAIVGK